ncbi:MAG: CHAT domain-containing protein, partial [Bacteroidota bacterium]
VIVKSVFSIAEFEADSDISLQKDEAIDFVKSYVFGNVNYPSSAIEKYTSLSNGAVSFFLDLKEGTELIKKNRPLEALEKWDACLKHPEFNNFSAETFFIIGTSLGERDGFTSYVLLQKALEISRSRENGSKSLEYSCLNAIVHLVVSQVEDDGELQELDVKAQQYSHEAHHLLAESAAQITESDASSSVYRIAAESLFWLGKDSLADVYIKRLTEQRQFYNHPELTDAYAEMLYGVKGYILGQMEDSEEHLKMAIDEIGESTSYLNYDLELPYAYLGAVYIKQKRYLKAIDYMERSVKTLQDEHYSSVEEPLKLIPPEQMNGKNSTYNLILCYLRLQYFNKMAVLNDASSVELEKVLKLTQYTNRLIKSWFQKAADEETLLRATKLIKKSNSNAIDLLWDYQDQFDDVVDRVYVLETEASAFYLNYLMELRKYKEKSETIDRISDLTLELTNAGQKNEYLKTENVRKRLTLLKCKAELWDQKSDELRQLGYNNVTPVIVDSDKAVVKYFMSFNDLYVTYYTANSSGWKRLEKINYHEKIKHFKRAIKSQSITSNDLQGFYDLLIKPVEQELEGVQRLTILPDEKLEGIPFELLKNEEGQFLINQYAIKYSYSSKFTKKPLPRPNNFLALAPGFTEGNDYPSQGLTRDVIEDYSFIRRSAERSVSLEPIPYSTDEVQEIGQLFSEKSLNNHVYTDKKATKENLVKHLSNTGIVHIATHGISRDKYNRGLFFAKNDRDNGFLSLQKLYNFEIKADLVVLSACKSGTGKVFEGEGVLALPRGFIYAGASNVIGSLWKVHDQKTKALMIAFYKHLLEKKVTYAEALRRAKLDCIEKGFLPIDWAGFVLIGN